MPPFGNCDHCNKESELFSVEDDQKFCSVCRSAYEEGRKAFIKHELKYAIAKHLIGKIDQVHVSSDLEKQRRYEVFCKGWDAGIEYVIELLEPLGECEPSICGKGCRGQYRCVGWAYRHAITLIKGENKCQ